MFNSPVQAATVTALGGRPENAGFTWLDKVKEGSIRGAEFDVNSTLGAGLHVTSNVVLWPKVFVFSLSQKRYDSLTTQQREWVALAARRATGATMRTAYDSRAAVDRLCALGTTFSAANSEQVAALRSRVKVVVDALAADPKSSALLSTIVAIGERHPRVERLEPSSTCRPVKAPGEPPRQVSALPDGTYRVQNTVEDLEAAGLDNSSGLTGVWTLRVANGTYDLRCRVELDPHDCGNSDYTGPLELGDLRGTRERRMVRRPAGPDVRRHGMPAAGLEHPRRALCDRRDLCARLVPDGRPPDLQPACGRGTEPPVPAPTVDEDPVIARAGTLAVTTVPDSRSEATWRRPPRAASRSASAVSPAPSGSAPPTPSSTTSTCTASSCARSVTDTRVARLCL